ncbi:MAG: hypothetical protein FJX67_04320 [Alphaproteobacteria bacterium]|nr:hypothetical protein [Alphaproteobacteria bacterium]
MAGTGIVFRRIVVAVDSPAAADPVLETAADIARRLEAELEGLFIEDENLLRLADLNVGRAFNALTGRETALDAAAMELLFRGEAARIRHALEVHVGRANLRHRFRIVRGMVERTLGEAGAGDLLVLSLAGRTVGARIGPHHAVLSALSSVRNAVLLVRPGTRLSGHALVLYGPEPDGSGLLAAAAHLVAGTNGRLTILLERDQARSDRLAAQAAEEAGRLGLAADLRTTDRVSLDAVCGLLGAAGAGVFAVRASHALLTGADRAALLERIGCPLLIVP